MEWKWGEICSRKSSRYFSKSTQKHNNEPCLKKTCRLAKHCKEISLYVFPEKELGGISPNFHIHVSVSDLYISTPRSVHLFFWSRIGRPIVGIYKSLTDVAAQFIFCECLFRIFGIVSLPSPPRRIIQSFSHHVECSMNHVPCRIFCKLTNT